MTTKNLFILLFFIIPSTFLFHPKTSFAATFITSDITQDTTWTKANSPYVINNYIKVLSGATLTIDPGVIIKMNNTYVDNFIYFDIHGKLITKSTPTDKIYITDYRDDTIGGDTNQDGTSTVPDIGLFGQWLIYFYPESQGSVFNNVEVRYASLIGFLGFNTTVQNIGIEHSYQGILSSTFDDIGNTMTFNNIHIDSTSITGFEIYGGDVTIKDSTINNIKEGYGISVYDAKLTLVNATTTGAKNGAGIGLLDSVATISNSSIKDNSSFGIYSETSTVDARNNWWGDETGPYNPELNPNGKGNSVSNNVTFTPWLTKDPNDHQIECCSSVLFLPGIQASRLYKEGIISENQLWEPNINSDVTKLFLTVDGKSIYPGIYTRDIINRTNYPLLNQDIYRTFTNSLNTLVSEKSIVEWQPYAYDWRLDISDIINDGALQSDESVAKIIPLVERMAAQSKTGKVTLVGHSNGGLLAKALIQALQKNHKENLIDKMILVASPELGTPKSMAALLHGYDQALLGGILLNTQTARTFSQNLPAAYTLLPSQQYFSLNAGPMVTFDSSIDSISNLRKVYGSSISDYSTYTKFLTAQSDHRLQPSSNRVDLPSVANNILLANATALHKSLDGWQLPSGITAYQIVGTGLNTVSGISYNTKSVCSGTSCSDQLDYAPLFTSRGDGTVVDTSAQALNSPTYFMNLQKYNNDKNLNVKHANILESKPVQQVINDMITETNITVDRYISILSLTAQPQTKISIHSPVTIDLYDGYGNHTGVSSSTLSDTVQLVDEQIPNSYYMPFGEGVYTGVDSSVTTTIILKGTDIGTFTLNIDNGTTPIEYKDVPVLPETEAYMTTNSATSSVLFIDYDGDGTVDDTVTATKNFNALNYLNSLKKIIMGFAIKDSIKTNLIKKLDKITTQIQKGTFVKAESTLQKYLNMINKHDRKFSKHLTSEEINTIITSLTTLIDQLGN